MEWQFLNDKAVTPDTHQYRNPMLVGSKLAIGNQLVCTVDGNTVSMSNGSHWTVYSKVELY